MADAPLRVLLAAADPLARSALAARIAGEPGLLLAAEVASPRPGDAADLVVWDLGLDPTAALEHLQDVQVPLLVLAPDEDSGVDALLAGARGALLRGGDLSELGPALRAIAAGLCVVDPAVIAAAAPSREAPGAAPEELTPREHEVLQLVAEGLSNRAIAARLGISEHTAKFHVNAILSKLGVQRRSEAVARAARLGLVVF